VWDAGRGARLDAWVDGFDPVPPALLDEDAGRLACHARASPHAAEWLLRDGLARYRPDAVQFAAQSIAAAHVYRLRWRRVVAAVPDATGPPNAASALDLAEGAASEIPDASAPRD